MNAILSHGKVTVIVCLIAFLFALYAWHGVEWIDHDIMGAKLPARCELFFFFGESQPTFTVALGCPGKDLVRLWPLPVTSPWFEDWWEFHQPGLITGLLAADRFLAWLPRQVPESPH